MTALRYRQAGVLQIREWALRGRLFAVVDATDTPAVPARAAIADEGTAVSLYRGRAEEEWSAIAPFLFRVDPPTLEWIAGELWTAPWGIFVLADQPLDALRLHFRRILTVEAPDGESWYFRFYDPRVLPGYLATCTDAEATAFFGPVRAFGVTDQATYGITVIAPESPSRPSAAERTQPIVMHR
ncbi:MAG: DUF4123 domain-containing protein [Gemmatimonadales bacterium]